MKELWLKGGILTQSKLIEMQKFVLTIMHLPADCGRIPRKLETGFSGFTAAQYINWVYSLVFHTSFSYMEKLIQPT